MVIETPNWNRDKFGETQPAGERLQNKRQSAELRPIVGETLAGYNRRILGTIQKYEEISLDAHTGRTGRKMWFTHKTPSECWICEQININWMISDILDLVNNAIDGEKYIFRENKHNQFELLPTPT